MNLKRNDQLILIVGVVILIVAAVAIAFYTSANKEEINPYIEPTETFNVTWTERTADMTVDGRAFKTYNDPIPIDVSGGVLTSVHINLTWSDDHVYGLLKNKGLDTLTAEITYNGYSQKISSKGSGSMSFDDFRVNSKPTVTSVSAKSLDDAKEKVKSNFSDKDKASFDTNIKVDTGERLWRPLKYLRDKGNNFEIEVTYTYYVFDVEGPEGNDNGDNTPPTGLNGYNGAYGDFYENLCYGRGMI